MPLHSSERERTMAETADTTNNQAPAAAEPATTPATPAEPTAQAPATGKTPPWGSDENFNPEKAWELIQNLRAAEARGREAMEKVETFEKSTAERNKALAEALGLTEPPKSEDDLAETVKALQAQFEASQRETSKLRVAAEKGVPPEMHHLLTETDPEKLSAQAEMAAEYARLKAAAEGKPEFQANPGQGQGGQPTKTEGDAVYESLFGSQA